MADQVPPVTSAPSGDSKNVFTELFGKDVSQKNAGLMNTVAQQQEKKSGPFFGPKPQVDTLAKLKEVSAKPGKPGAAALKVSFFILLLTIAGFLTQNSSRFSVFGVNPALHVEQATSQLSTLNAEVQVQKHLIAALLLDEYSSKMDEYFYNIEQSESEYSSSNKRAEYQAAAQALRPELLNLLVKIRTYLSGSLTQEELVAATVVLDELTTSLHAKSGEVEAQSLLQDIQDLETTKMLLQSDVFKSYVMALPSAEVTDEQLQKVASEFSTINASVNAIIGNIKAARKDWSIYLNEVERVTKSVDPLFNTEFPGNLKLDDLRLSPSGTITVSGETVTDDTKNFTLVSNLIDALEASRYFKNVEDRSYTKSSEGTTDNTYTGNFRISMEIEQ